MTQHLLDNQAKVRKIATTLSVVTIILCAFAVYTALGLMQAERCVQQSQNALYGLTYDAIHCGDASHNYWDHWSTADNLYVRELWLVVPLIILAAAAVSLWLVWYFNGKRSAEIMSMSALYRNLSRILTVASILALVLLAIIIVANGNLSDTSRRTIVNSINKVALYAVVPAFLATNTAAIVFKLASA